jgi:hypothetical protein
MILLVGVGFLFCGSLLAQDAPGSQAQAAAAPEHAELPADIKPLELNREVERELKGDDVQHYSVQLTAGEFLHVVTLQKGIHLLVALFRLNGDKIVQAERPNGDFGPVPLSAVVDAAGMYVLSVDAGPQNTAMGHYQIKITAERSPTPEDLKRLEAERIFLEAMIPASDRTPEKTKDNRGIGSGVAGVESAARRR